jgi:energy-coupling factor transporter ATP-binding protein EcfA2
MANLLNNLPVEELTKENDYLGVIDKAELIKTILESNTDQFDEIKMFVLYGDWGSGKSTLMKYLKNQLKNDFNTFFFDTWQYEKDDNLPQTLLDFVLKESQSVSEEISGDILKFGGKLFRGLGKSVKIKIPLFPKGPSIDFNPAAFVKEFEEKDISFYDALEGFKKEFIRWEDRKTDEKPHEYNIIFIDDLDRCEPENVLNLLSAIKLFFTYGEKTIFFFGVDKKAVQQAIETKYKDAVKSEEYLEKIFDISFAMPKHESVLKLVSTYFSNEKIEQSSRVLNKEIASFFRALHFTNPRKLKKVLNKYLLIANAKEKLSDEHPFSKYIGNIYRKGQPEYNYFETILTLYLIAVKEFDTKLFKILFDFKRKELSLFKLSFDRGKENFTTWNYIKNRLDNNSCSDPLRLLFEKGIYFSKTQRDDLMNFMIAFCPENIVNGDDTFYDYNTFYDRLIFEEKRIDYYVLKYIYNNLRFFNSLKNYSNKSISDIYQGIKQIL